VPKPASPLPSGSPRAAAIRLLSRRDYTRAELGRRLIERGYDADAVDEALAALVSQKWLDDARVAAAHTRTASGVKGRGRRRIARELEARGVGRDIAREALGAISREDEEAAVRKFLSRKRLGPKLTIEERRRLFQQLLRRGFDADVIVRVLKAI
jgi:regulatory protein